MILMLKDVELGGNEHQEMTKQPHGGLQNSYLSPITYFLSYLSVLSCM